MRTPSPAPRAALPLALALLAACAARAPVMPASAVAPPASTLSPEEALPGIPLDGLDAVQQRTVAAFADRAFLYCGTPRTLSQSLRDGGGCQHAKRMGRLAAHLARTGASADELLGLTTEYYASFEAGKRASLDVTTFGPPLGDPKAPITLVEFSDFTCPFCQSFRPTLEKFVKERPGRVKLVFKPFPIESHPHALEAAQAAEWARAQGIFWPMHDALFDDPHALSPAELAGRAAALGRDGDDLRAALEDGRLLPRVRASQAEARASGLRGTPTLFLDGRRHLLGDYSEWMLEFTLQDEEAWGAAGGGWGRDLPP